VIIKLHKEGSGGERKCCVLWSFIFNMCKRKHSIESC
jgi:hypothetical protein